MKKTVICAAALILTMAVAACGQIEENKTKPIITTAYQKSDVSEEMNESQADIYVPDLSEADSETDNSSDTDSSNSDSSSKAETTTKAKVTIKLNTTTTYKRSTGTTTKARQTATTTTTKKATTTTTKKTTTTTTTKKTTTATTTSKKDDSSVADEKWTVVKEDTEIKKGEVKDNITEGDIYVTKDAVMKLEGVTIKGDVYVYGQLEMTDVTIEGTLHAYNYDEETCGAYNGKNGDVIVNGECNVKETDISDDALEVAFEKHGKDEIKKS